jgi:hypothetical protein
MITIASLITDNIIAALKAMTVVGGYDFAPGAVEQERSEQIIAGRYPFIEVAGPTGVIDFAAHSQGDIHTLSYTITYCDKLNDTNISTDDPLPKQIASVVGNLHKAIMVDHTRGGYAIKTMPRDYGYVSYQTDQGEHFEVYINIDVETLINTFNMATQG